MSFWKRLLGQNPPPGASGSVTPAAGNGQREKTLGPDHPDIITSLSNQAALYCEQGKYAEAEPLYKRSLAILEEALGPDHPDVAASLDDLAELYIAQGKCAQAELLKRRRLEIFLKSARASGHPHPHLQPAVMNYLGLLIGMGMPLSQTLYKLQSLGPEVRAMLPWINVRS